MKNSISFDTLINHIVYTINHILDGKNYPQSIRNYLYVIVYGMIINYGEEYIEDIYNTIDETKFVLKNDSNSLNLTLNDGLFYKNCLSNNYLYKGVSFDDGIKLEYDVTFKEIECSSIKTLEMLTYQLNHILFSKKKKISLGDNIKIRFDYFRNGVVTEDKINDNSSVINKIFSILQTEEIIKNVLKIKNNKTKNEKFNEALKLFSDIDIDSYKVDGMDALVNLFRPLYNIKEMKNLIDSYDSESLLEKEFDCILGKNSYKKACLKIDILNDMISRCEVGISHNYYELSLEYVNIRNNFINKYIKYKYA